MTPAQFNELVRGWQYKLNLEKRVLGSLLLPILNTQLKTSNQKSLDRYCGSAGSKAPTKGKMVVKGEPGFNEFVKKHFSEKTYKEMTDG